METIGMFEARTHFSDYIPAVREGKEFVITSRGEEVAKLMPIQRGNVRSQRRCGYFRQKG